MGSTAAEEEYITPAKAAKFLHVHPKTIHRWTLEGRLPCIVTLGGHRRFLLRDVLDAVEKMAAGEPVSKGKGSSEESGP